MISAPIHALADYYARLAADPSAAITPYGYALQPISFCLVLSEQGELHTIADLRETAGRKTTAHMIAVPHYGSKRTSGIRPYFLWDKSALVLGRDRVAEERYTGDALRLTEQFAAFRDLHLGLESRIRNDEFSAVCRFLRSWEPSNADQLPDWVSISGTNLVFKIVGRTHYVHDLEPCRCVWLEVLESSEPAPIGHCLVTGQLAPIARLHPAIKGVHDPGGQAEKSLVSINTKEQPAFGSFGKEQAFNAPISRPTAFNYATVLNRLLADRRRKIRLGDTTVVFWAGASPGAARAGASGASGVSAEQAEDAFAVLAAGFSGPPSAEDASTVDNARVFLERAREALLANKGLQGGDTPFFILGLSPNASRLAVRFWLAGTVDEFAKRLARHVGRLQIVKPDDADPLTDLTLRRLVLETARPKNGWPDEESVSPLLAGAVLRAVLSGGPYPQALLGGVIARIRAEGFAHPDKRNDHVLAAWRRAAVLKAMVISDPEQESYVSLNLKGPPAYQLGRLFAALEKTQDEAFDNSLNATIKDRYFGSASANPIAAFPRLLRLHVHHLGKLANPGRRTNLEKLVQEICSNLGEQFPRNLALEQQGQFFLGYYHQRQDLFTRKSDDESKSNTTTESKES